MSSRLANGAYQVAKNFADSLIENKYEHHKYCLHSWTESGTEITKLYCQSSLVQLTKSMALG